MTLQLACAAQFGAFALDAKLDVAMPGVTALYGRSGAGKTTLLRCIAGLEPQARGRVVFDGEVWQDDRRFVPAHRRDVGMVFQDARLFPHLSVRGNLLFAAQRAQRAVTAMSLERAAELLGLGQLLEREIDGLSGGQRQRVAIARALLTQPRLLLLDEPLASLDAESRATILQHLDTLVRELSLPVIYVTHAIQEVMQLADTLAIIEDGRIRASGPMNDLLLRPDLPLLHLADAGAVLHGTISGHDADNHLSLVAVADATFAIAMRTQAIGSAVRLRVEARDVSIALDRPQRTSINNILPARVLDVLDDQDPSQRLVRLEAGGQRLLSRITRRSVQQLGLTPGMPVHAQVKSVSLYSRTPNVTP